MYNDWKQNELIVNVNSFLNGANKLTTVRRFERQRKSVSILKFVSFLKFCVLGEAITPKMSHSWIARIGGTMEIRASLSFSEHVKFQSVRKFLPKSECFSNFFATVGEHWWNRTINDGELKSRVICLISSIVSLLRCVFVIVKNWFARDLTYIYLFA